MREFSEIEESADVGKSFEGGRFTETEDGDAGMAAVEADAPVSPAIFVANDSAFTLGG